MAWASTDVDGAFRLDSLPPDQALRIAITSDGHRTLTQDGVHAGVNAGGTEQVFVLDPGLRVGGTVTNAAGTPVAGVGIWVKFGNDSKNVTTDADGRFVVGGLPQEEITVQVASWGQNYVATEPVKATPGDLNIQMTVEQGESIGGVILDADGTPLKQVQLAALDEQGQQVAGDWVWAGDGSFEIKGLRPGRYRIRASRWADGKFTTLTEVEGVATDPKGQTA